MSKLVLPSNLSSLNSGGFDADSADAGLSCGSCPVDDVEVPVAGEAKGQHLTLGSFPGLQS